ncbi:TetR/AcrR family transcriptional regulator [Actinophytocola gossypii]|uniref:TetR family transcriptional regulator n=1 Tax=Actinophytocola gossypii TaxID=2812003 RepID=A0ABT2JGU9_9PSEU|nr:TetR/AcrR family transcriptional regulator [Actinophytocola gossypii]MCT2586996.1 TetR family transcriptional regulator [Actinophytocola gossypii]
MGRPRKISDEELMDACGHVIGRHGAGFTLAQVAAEAGVAVGTVSGRFGSKRGLLVAMMTSAAAGVEQRMRAAAAAHEDPIDAVIAAALVTAEGIDDPGTTANHLAQLGVDLTDPELRDGLGVLRERVQKVLASLLAEAVLPDSPPVARAARIVAAMVHGAQLDWALRPRGRLAVRLRADLRAVLTAWR